MKSVCAWAPFVKKRMGQGASARGKNLQYGERSRGGIQFMIICESLDATGPRNLFQAKGQALVGSNLKGVSELYDLRKRGAEALTLYW